MELPTSSGAYLFAALIDAALIWFVIRLALSKHLGVRTLGRGLFVVVLAFTAVLLGVGAAIAEQVELGVASKIGAALVASSTILRWFVYAGGDTASRVLKAGRWATLGLGLLLLVLGAEQELGLGNTIDALGVRGVVAGALLGAGYLRVVSWIERAAFRRAG